MKISNGNNNNNNKVDSTVHIDPRLKMKESEKMDKCLVYAGELKKSAEHESEGDANYTKCPRNTCISKGLESIWEELEIKGRFQLILTIVLLQRVTRILRSVLRPSEYFSEQ